MSPTLTEDVAGGPYRTPGGPPEPPAKGTSATDLLLARRHADPIAAACLSVYHHGAEREDVLTLALHSYATALDEARRQLAWYMERHSAPMAVRSRTP
jgi:hypothetical protein